jgi:hypothetical protein
VQVLPARAPQALGTVQELASVTLVPAAAAKHALSYVFPSQPHTGADCSVQLTGMVAQTPGASASPHRALDGKLQ